MVNGGSWHMVARAASFQATSRVFGGKGTLLIGPEAYFDRVHVDDWEQAG